MAILMAERNRTSTAPMAHRPTPAVVEIAAQVVAALAVPVALVAVAAVAVVAVQVDPADADPAAAAAVDHSKQ
jgi:hypothetical protein